MARNRNTPTARTRASGGRPGTSSRGGAKPGPASGRSAAKPKPPAKKPNPAAKSTSRAKPSAGGSTARPGKGGSKPVPTTSAASPLRRRLERASAPVLLRLNAVPRWVPLAAMLVLLLAGLFVPGPLAAVFLTFVALILVWLLALAWPALPPPGRLGRLMIIGLVLFSALIRLSGLHIGPQR